MLVLRKAVAMAAELGISCELIDLRTILLGTSMPCVKA